MAKQSIASISTQEDLCNWEFVNQFDFEIDDESIYEVQSIDFVESIDSLSSSSDEDDDDVKKFPTNDVKSHDNDLDLDHDHDDVNVKCARVLDLGQNHECFDGDLSSNGDDIDGVYGYFDGSSLHVHGHDSYNGGYHQHANANDDAVDAVDDDEGDVDDGYGMYDEMVPWDKLMRQRIRKSGKISIGKMAKSKKSALVFTRPGCVRGKHGLGLMVY
ncbi:hypothetical protein BVRB_9g216850 [Beta vulgaris subsp. vulgaris]|uniref:uncharacterized protein LOC104904294 n=1 Tax=Beta vulgaris subsp. vulgaris TaxID=3555 RepID=UPI00053F8317|nr:uncharacterized protein LOC104904294 [Beta vulgaris subsp. vulgaris]KMT00380.1 hypothetical protein BVRB_9g216850 [Beta vulgaris subsp. vulgaris]